MATTVTQAYIAEVAHKHGVKISDAAKALYSKLPTRAAVDDMITHAAKLAKAVGLKTITTNMARVEMAHYSEKK